MQQQQPRHRATQSATATTCVTTTPTPNTKHQKHPEQQIPTKTGSEPQTEEYNIYGKIGKSDMDGKGGAEGHGAGTGTIGEGMLQTSEN